VLRKLKNPVSSKPEKTKPSPKGKDIISENEIVRNHCASHK